MQELETRIIDIDVEDIRSILLTNGAEKVKMEDFSKKRDMPAYER